MVAHDGLAHWQQLSLAASQAIQEWALIAPAQFLFLLGELFLIDHLEA